jgi:hypothetical protein
MNKYKFNKLINLDHHSDLPDLCRDLYLNDGTWAGYIEGKENKTFVWIMPFPECYRKSPNAPVYFKKLDRDVFAGRCDDRRNPFVNSPKTCGWGKTVKKVGFITKRELNNVSCIGITLSPDYIDKSLAYFAANLLYDKGIISQKIRNRETKRRCEDCMI